MSSKIDQFASLNLKELAKLTSNGQNKIRIKKVYHIKSEEPPKTVLPPIPPPIPLKKPQPVAMTKYREFPAIKSPCNCGNCEQHNNRATSSSISSLLSPSPSQRFSPMQPMIENKPLVIRRRSPSPIHSDSMEVFSDSRRVIFKSSIKLV